MTHLVLSFTHRNPELTMIVECALAAMLLLGILSTNYDATT